MDRNSKEEEAVLMMCAFEMLTQNNITTEEANKWIMSNFGVSIADAKPAHIMCAYTDITIKNGRDKG